MVVSLHILPSTATATVPVHTPHAPPLNRVIGFLLRWPTLKVLHYDEICLHSNRWHRSVRARPTHYSRNDRVEHEKRRLAGACGDSDLGLALTRKDCAGEVLGSFWGINCQ